MESLPRRVVGGPTAVVAGAVLAASMLAFFGEWWWMLDLVANFRAQLAVVGSVVVGAGLTIRTRSVMLLGALITLVNLAPIIPLYLGGGQTDAQPQLRVASYNLLFSAARHPDEVVEWLGSVEADVVFLHEVGRPWSRVLEAADLPWRVVGPQRDANQRFDTVVLVHDGARVEFIDLIARSTPAVALDIDGVEVTVLGVHASSPFDADGAARRDQELLEIAKWVTTQRASIVVAGDLNSTPFSWSFRRMLEVSRLHNSQIGFGLQPTWPSTNVLLRIPIDHLLYSDGLRVVDRQVLPSLGSDHFPLVVGLTLGG